MTLELAILAGLVVVAAAMLKKSRARRDESVGVGGTGVTDSDVEAAQRFGGGGALAGVDGIREHPRIKPIKAPPDWIPSLRRMWRGEDVLERPRVALPFVATWSSLDQRLLPAGVQPGDPACFLVQGTDGHWYYPMLRHESQVGAYSGRSGGQFHIQEFDPDQPRLIAGETIPASELIFRDGLSGWFFVCLRPHSPFRPPVGGWSEDFGDLDEGRSIADARRNGADVGRAAEPFANFGNRIEPTFARWLLGGMVGEPPPDIRGQRRGDGSWSSQLDFVRSRGYATAAEVAAAGWGPAVHVPAAGGATARVR